MIIRLLSILLFLILSYNFYVLAQKRDISKYLDAKIELIEKRISILKRYKEYRDEAYDIGWNTKKWSNKKYEDDLLRLERELEDYKDLKKSLGANMTIVRDFFEKKGPKTRCSLQLCVDILGEINHKLVKDIININQQIVINGIDSIDVKRATNRDASELDQLLSDIMDLEFRNFACERSIADYVGDVDFDTEKMGKCFVSVLKEESKTLGYTPSLQNGNPQIQSSIRPYDNRLNLDKEILERLSKKILEYDDYKLTPWEMLRLCVSDSTGGLEQALDICYQVLRFNRSRPDVIRKYLDIRGDRQTGGDNSGDWYHLFAMARIRIKLGRITSWLYFPGVFMSQESTIDFSVSAGWDSKEILNDLNGIGIGASAVNNFEQTNKPPSELCKFGDIFSYDQD